MCEIRRGSAGRFATSGAEHRLLRERKREEISGEDVFRSHFPSGTSRSLGTERVARNRRLDYNRGIISAGDTLLLLLLLLLLDNCKWRPFMPQGRLIKAADK